MYLLGHVGTPELKERFLKPMVEGRVRSAFLMTEPAELNGAGADPSMMITTCRKDGNHWVVMKRCYGAAGPARKWDKPPRRDKAFQKNVRSDQGLPHPPRPTYQDADGHAR